jgi:predicted alpha/beta superfamily hydrolase
MLKKITTKLDEKVITIYRGPQENLPVIYSNDYSEGGSQLLKCCEEIDCPPFHLVTISKMKWDSDMSPWPSEPVVTQNDRFFGHAPAYLHWLLEQVVPYSEGKLQVSNSISYIAGYSMAGLFALWSLYETDFFSGAVCASGSLWYPGFSDFALSHNFKRKSACVYMSLGDRESKVKNLELQKTETVFRTLYEHNLKKNVLSVFELNPGNHYQHIDARVAKGCQWILSKGNKSRSD